MQTQPRSRSFTHLGLLSLALLPVACSSGGGGNASGAGNRTTLTAADLDGRWNVTTRVTSVSGSAPGVLIGQTSTFPVNIALVGTTVVIRSDDGSITNGTLDGSRVRATVSSDGPPVMVSVTDFGIVNRQIDGTITMTESSNGAVVSTVVERLTGVRTAAAARSVENFVANVQLAGGVTATRMNGTPPAANGGPAVVSSVPGTVINGGTGQVEVNCQVGIDALLVFVEGADGYYRIPLGAAKNLVNLVLSLGAAIPSDSFQCACAGERAGQVGPPSTATVTRRGVGTGRLQINLSWDSAADLDLHVIEPGSNEIWYGSTNSPSGGQLDLDSNAACSAGISNENVTYAGVTPPAGEYIVRVDNFDACSAAQSNYVVRINIEGRAPMVFNGTLSGPGSGAGAGAGREVARFTF